jgi:hypothetical protein
MSSRWIRTFASLAAAAGAAWGAFAHRGTPLTFALLALVCAGLIGFACARALRGRTDALHDPAVSTLVFPPESKFQQSVLPRR